MTETINLATASGSKAGSTLEAPLKLDELIALRKTLKSLKLAIENADEWVAGNDVPLDWEHFTMLGGRRITVPGEMMVELLKEISARASKEVGVIEDKFKQWKVDPSCSEDES